MISRRQTPVPKISPARVPRKQIHKRTTIPRVKALTTKMTDMKTPAKKIWNSLARRLANLASGRRTYPDLIIDDLDDFWKRAHLEADERTFGKHHFTKNRFSMLHENGVVKIWFTPNIENGLPSNVFYEGVIQEIGIKKVLRGYFRHIRLWEYVRLALATVSLIVPAYGTFYIFLFSNNRMVDAILLVPISLAMIFFTKYVANVRLSYRGRQAMTEIGGFLVRSSSAR